MSDVHQEGERKNEERKRKIEDEKNGRSGGMKEK